MLVNLNDVLPQAQKEHYGVGLFNTINLEMAQGVLAAAQETGSPVIIGTAEVLLNCSSLFELSGMLLPLAKKAEVPVVLHFDHGLTEEKVKEAIDCGFTSVMYDCSTLSFEENIAAVAKMVEYAHARGVTVEGELGHVGSNANAADESIYTDPDKAAEFARRTGVDALAVAIGTAHGTYHSKPKLALDVLEKIAAAVEVPLVLHGGSGLSDEDFKACIARGIAKVNIFTDLNIAAEKAAYDGYREGLGYSKVMPSVTAAVHDAALKKMTVFESGRYKEIL